MKDIKKMDITDIEKAIKDEREKLRVFRFSAIGTRSKNVKEGSMLRKTIARLLTEQKARNK
jgi:ribosomal protein L29